MFRKDQIWFAEKDEKGVSDLFSLQDFSDVRENTPWACKLVSFHSNQCDS